MNDKILLIIIIHLLVQELSHQHQMVFIFGEYYKKLVQGNMNIGIMNADFVTPTKNICVESKHEMYGYCAEGGYTFKFNTSSNKQGLPRFTEDNDILTMKLILNKNGGTLTYQLNNDKEHIAYDDIVQRDELNYCLAVTTYELDLCIEIIP